MTLAVSDTPSPEPALHVARCSKSFQGPGQEKVRAVDDVSFTVPAGQIVALLGSNGAGKSTLLSMVAGGTLPDEGRIHVSGADLTELPSWKRVGHLRLVRQNPEYSVFPALTIEENFALAAASTRRRPKMRRAELREEATKLLEPFGLNLESRLSALAGSLSGGQRQAVAVAIAMLAGTGLLLLDEHVAALDPRSARLVSDQTEQGLRATGASALMVTHDMTHALERSDRILMMHRGQLVLDISGPDKDDLDAPALIRRFETETGGRVSDRELLS
ncbi:ABC transporter ATP-binding protein [Dactylosporangium sp. CA-233914]|uniref:ABC transporter ATP-binding protein n=1 Tax=Dactylosporangium sp. CA-233914 TaxID=3239934 RepID=UPI003D8BECC7